MKSHVFQMKYFLAGIYIICVIFTCFNARFYHTPLAKISSVTEKETMSRKGTRDAEEYYYTQKITARILNGTHKGEEISISNEYTTSQVQNQKYHRGDTVLLSGSRENPGKSIRSIKRDGYLALLAGGLFFLLIWRFMVIANNAPDLFGAMLVVGVMGHIAIQVILNIAVVTNTIPNTGISLPFISYGGSSVLFLLIEMGLVLSVGKGIKLKDL